MPAAPFLHCAGACQDAQQAAKFPCFTLVTICGEYAEFNHWPGPAHSRSGYYAACKRRRVQPAVCEASVQLKAVVGASGSAYGSRRLRTAVASRGVVMGLYRLRRLMRQHGLRSDWRRKFVHTTDSKHALPISPNVLDRQFNPTQPNQAWVADITCQIVRWLDAHPYSAQQIFQRLGEAGYVGGISIVKDYVHRIRPRHQEAFLKLDFAAGEAAQIDWGEWGPIAVGSTRRRLSFFLMVLC